METLKKIISEFRINASNESESLNSGGVFKNVAECMLAGHFLVTDGTKEVRVRPTALEFYYHEEKDCGIKDPIVYHRNTKSAKNPKPLFPTGFLHNHVSGIDLTFEHENDGFVRASVLIREFIIETDDDECKKAMEVFNVKVNEKEVRSTNMYPALFSQFSVLDGGFSVKWVDGDDPAVVDFVSPRKNVYQDNDKARKIPCSRKWQARIKE